VAAFATELDLARGADARLDAAITHSESAMNAAAHSPDPSTVQSGARALVEQLATTLQACLLTRFAPAYVSESFVASRLDGAHGHTFGTLASDLVHASAGEVIQRTFPD
jgi:putative acyl-CoA dehydrogenase